MHLVKAENVYFPIIPFLFQLNHVHLLALGDTFTMFHHFVFVRDAPFDSRGGGFAPEGSEKKIHSRVHLEKKITKKSTYYPL